MDKPIIGKRVILFPFVSTELNHFVELHRGDKQGMMGNFCLKAMSQDEGENYVAALIFSGQIKIWSCYTKEGKASRKIGYIYLNEISSFSAQIVGIIDKSILRGLAKVIKQGKYSFSEDAIRTIVSWVFNVVGFTRVEYRVFSDNKLSLRLAEKSGFQREGVLRKSFKIDNEYKDMVIYAILKDSNKISSTDNKDLTKE